MKNTLVNRACLAISALSLALAAPRAAQATEAKSLVVTTLTDVTNANDNLTSLREAISYANSLASNDTITFAVDGTITLSSALSSVSSAATKGTLTIDGTGHNVLIYGNNAVRMLTVNTGGNLTISHLNVSNCKVGSGAGGAIVVSSGATLNISGSTFSGNTASTSGGAISNSGALSIDSSTFNTNSATTSGGAVYSAGALSVSNSVFSGNSAGNGGAFELTGSNNYSFNSSTIWGNIATSAGGGIDSHSEAVNGSTPSTKLSLNECTLYGNSAAAGGAIQNSQGQTTLVSCTVTRNTAPVNSGSGIRSTGASNVQTTIQASIVADNRVASGGSDSGTDLDYTSSSNPYISLGNNAIGHGNAVSVFPGEYGVYAALLNLGALTSNGGPTPTVVLGSGSIAINAGPAVYNANSLDQRGFARIQGGRVDIGAYELANRAPTDISLSNASIAENSGDNAAVGTLSTTDADITDSATYTLVSGAGSGDNGLFNISGNTLQANSSFDFESGTTSYGVRIRTTDSGSAYFEKAFTVTVTNVNEAPTDIALSNDTIPENSGANAAIGTLSSSDPDAGDSASYSLVTGTGDDDNAAFTIGGLNNDTLIALNSFDFETKSSYSVRIRVTDGGNLTFEKPFTIHVSNGNEAPTANAQSVTVAENGSSSITLTGTDPENDTLTYSYGQGAHGTVTGTGADVTYTPDANYFGADSFTFTVNDGTNTSPTATVSVTVSGETVAPVIAISAPAQGKSLALADFIAGTANGTATDNIGVTSVDVKLSRTVNNVKQFWNGTTWTTDSASVRATLSSPNATSTNWSLDNVPSLGDLTSAAYSVVVSANDAAGNTSLAAVRTFYLVEPGTLTATIEHPAANAILLPTDLTNIDGTVAANNTLRVISVKLYRTVGGVKYYWNGVTFSTDTTTIAASTHAGIWSIGVPPIEQLDYGSYGVSIVANDVNGLAVTVTRAFTLVGETVPPTSSILHPAANSNLLPATFAAGVVDGVATDNVGVDSISVKLYRTVSGAKQFWTGSAWTSVSTNTQIDSAGLGTPSATWSIHQLPSIVDLTTGAYGVITQVKDAVGNSALSTVNFNIVADATPPVATIASPTANQHLKAAAFDANTVRGTATDVGGTVTSITVKLYRTISGVKYFWNGSAFTTASVAAPVSAPTLGTASTSWTLGPAPTSSDLVPGSYSIQASAKDSSGNTSTLATRNFVIDAPSAALKFGPSGESF